MTPWKRRLYEPATERLTDEGRELEKKVEAFLGPLFREAQDNGLCIRDVALIVMDTAMGNSLRTVIRRGLEERAKEREPKS